MLFRQAHLQGIAAGAITVAYRRWRAPTVKTGGQLRTAVGVLGIDSVETLHEREIDEAQARAAGYASRQALHAELAQRPEGRLYRIRFHLAGEDPRIALRKKTMLGAEDAAQLEQALHKLDARSRHGAWTQATLDLIAAHPGRLAAELAGMLGVEKAWFKPQVRKLKELGLTESLDIGYRLSPRGQAWRARSAP